MKRLEMIKDKDYFNFIIKNGKYYKDNNFVIYYVQKKQNDVNFPHFGIAIRKDIGKANIRNRLKRITRSIIDSNKKIFKNNYDYIIMIRRDCLNHKYEELNKSLVSIMKGINNEKK